MHEWSNLIQTVGVVIIGLLTWYLNNKKNDRDYIKEENDRLNKENKEKQAEIKAIKAENAKLRKELDNEHTRQN